MPQLQDSPLLSLGLSQFKMISRSMYFSIKNWAGRVKLPLANQSSFTGLDSVFLSVNRFSTLSSHSKVQFCMMPLNLTMQQRLSLLQMNKTWYLKHFNTDAKNHFLTKRQQRRKKTIEEHTDKQNIGTGVWQVTAYATSEEYNLERLREGLEKQNLYKPSDSSSALLAKGGADVIHAIANYQVSSEQRQIYFFREGSVVLWNIPELECISVLDFLKPYQIGPYDRSLVLEEREIMNYSYNPTSKKSILDSDYFYIGSTSDRPSLDVIFDKFTFSNSISLSVKLAIWEASLNHYIDSIEYVVEDLKDGKALRISRKEVTRKTGELFALRHSINLSSDLLDIPDFYWENEELETLYLQLCGYFSINRRTRVMNEKLNHCMELVELLTSHLSDRHHVRLEWMIIILIMIEVIIEVLHAVR